MSKKEQITCYNFLHGLGSSPAFTESFTTTVEKIAASRLDREIAAGNVKYKQLDPRIPDVNIPEFLRPYVEKYVEPYVKRHVRERMVAPAERSPEYLERLRKLNELVTRAQLKTTGRNLGVPKAVILNKMAPGVGPATAKMPGTPGVTVMSDENAGRFLRQVSGNTIDKIKAVMGTINAEHLVPPAPVDPTLNRMAFQHELGEAAEFGRNQVFPHASHLGVEPIIRENLSSLGDPEAQTLMQQLRQGNPDDLLVSKLLRSVGATPDAPIPLEGAQHRALNRILTDSAEQLSPSARGRALQFMQQMGKEVPYVPEHVRKSLSEDFPAALKRIVESYDKGNLMNTLRAELPAVKPIMTFVRKGV